MGESVNVQKIAKESGTTKESRYKVQCMEVRNALGNTKEFAAAVLDAKMNVQVIHMY